MEPENKEVWRITIDGLEMNWLGYLVYSRADKVCCGRHATPCGATDERS